MLLHSPDFHETVSHLIVAGAASTPSDFLLDLFLLNRVLAGLSSTARAGILLAALSTGALVALLA